MGICSPVTDEKYSVGKVVVNHPYIYEPIKAPTLLSGLFWF